jgi:protocatechuate 3,4-dioxygenase beta subunit
MRFSVFRASIGLLCSWIVGAFAQAPSPATTNGVISGIVLDAAGNSPIRRAIVKLSTVETQPQDAVAWTDANGRFSFGYLPAGRYQLRVTKDGYQPAVNAEVNPRRPPAIIQLASGEARTDFIFRLQLISSISGVVLDEDGDPLAGVQVLVMRPDFQRGKRKLMPGPMAMTDSNGRYRLSGLVGGQYAVVVHGMNRSAVKIHPEATAGQPKPQYSYGVQYYPIADRAEAATLITVQPGQEISSIDFRLQARPATSIEGKIIVPVGAGSVKDIVVNIMSEDYPNRLAGSSGASQPEYHFSHPQLTPGSYVLVAQATIDGKRYRGVQTINLGAQGLRDIAIPLEPTIDLAGTLSIEGPDAAKHAPSFVSLVPGDDIPWNAPQLRANVNKDGSFKIAGVPPGIWDINAGPVPSGGYIKSMRLGDQDVLTEEMMIRPSTAESLKIVIGTRAATIEGDVLQGDQPMRAMVLLTPDGKFRHVTSFNRFTATDDKGHFEIKNATPGQYQLYAFDEFDQRNIQDPDFLKPFEKYGLPVTLREGPNDSQKLSMIPASPPQGAHQ